MQIRKETATALYCAAGLALIGSAFLLGPHARTSSTGNLSVSEVKAVQAAPKRAVESITSELKQLKGAANPAEADKASRRMMTVGYALAAKMDFAVAREAFLAVDQEYSGAGSRNPDFGSIPDQAKYQAIVCLVAEGKKDEAKKEFREFLRERPTSNLATMAFRRLVRLNGGAEDPSDVSLYERAISLQEAATKKAIASCGPKVIRYYLANYADQNPPLADVARLARQTEEGTSMLDMVRALLTYKVGAEGRELNAPDFLRQNTPFIWLQGDHFVLVEKLDHLEITAWDPMLDGPKVTKSPSADDAAFRAPILILNPN